MQQLVVGRVLALERDVNLNDLFKRDPSPGKRKQLKIAYLTRFVYSTDGIIVANMAIAATNTYLIPYSVFL